MLNHLLLLFRTRLIQFLIDLHNLTSFGCLVTCLILSTLHDIILSNFMPVPYSYYCYFLTKFVLLLFCLRWYLGCGSSLGWLVTAEWLLLPWIVDRSDSMLLSEVFWSWIGKHDILLLCDLDRMLNWWFGWHILGMWIRGILLYWSLDFVWLPLNFYGDDEHNLSNQARGSCPLRAGFNDMHLTLPPLALDGLCMPEPTSPPLHIPFMCSWFDGLVTFVVLWLKCFCSGYSVLVELCTRTNLRATRIFVFVTHKSLSHHMGYNVSVFNSN